ncbi:unnamed protein product, partial [Prorocentrum cordatum]
PLSAQTTPAGAGCCRPRPWGGASQGRAQSLGMSQVEVQAPPGLENVSGCQLQGAAEEEPATEDWRESLVDEVAASVQAHIEWRTAAAQEALWQRGQHEIRCIKEQQMAEAELLQGQLTSCAESCRRLEHENRALRSGLEALVKQLSTFWPAPPSPCGAASPPGKGARGATLRRTSSGPASACAQDADSPTSVAEPMKVSGGAPESEGAATGSLGEDLSPQRAPPTSGGEGGEAASMDAETPPGLSAAAGATAAPRDDGAEAGSPSSEAARPAPQALPFTITLRRADHVLLGLDVQPGESDANCLQVKAVRPGGAVEAWNRQCPGEMREIRPGDRIIRINDSQDAASMTEECYMKHLLRMTVVRSTPGASEDVGPEPDPKARQVELRADADEFVPQASALITGAAPLIFNQVATPSS